MAREQPIPNNGGNRRSPTMEGVKPDGAWPPTSPLHHTSTATPTYDYPKVARYYSG